MNEDVRRSAADALGKIKEPEALAPLIEALRDENEHVRRTVANSLGKFKAHGAIVELIEVMTNKNENIDVREIAAKAIELFDMGGEQ